MPQIKLTRGYYATVDEVDVESLSQFEWHVSGDTKYAARRDRGKVVYMHRQIVAPRKGQVVDHINRNGLDNTRANLRCCAHRQNLFNQAKKRGGTSRYKGVHLYKGKWVVQIRIDGVQTYLGAYSSEIEAAQKYDREVVRLRGDFGVPNFSQAA